MKFSSAPSIILSSLIWLLSPTFNLTAAEHTARWAKTGDGYWRDSANWDPPQYAGTSGDDVFDAVWDNFPVTLLVDEHVTIRNFTCATPGTSEG